MHSSKGYSVLKIATGNLNPDSKEDTIDNINYVIKSLLLEIDSYPPKNPIISLNGRDTMIRLLDLPPINNEKFVNLDNMIRYELSMHLPLSVDQTCYNYQILSIDNERTRVLAAAIKRSILTRLLKSLSMSGIYPNAITISSLVLFNAFVIKGLIEDDLTGLIYLRSSGGDIVISEFGYVSYARSFSIQEEAGKDSILKELSNSFETYYRSRPKTQKNIASNIHIISEKNKLPLGLTEDDISKISLGSKCVIHNDFDELTLATAIIGSDKAFPSLIRINLMEQIIKENKLEKKRAIKAKLSSLTPTIILIVLLIISALLTLQNYKLKEKLIITEKIIQDNKNKLEEIKKIENKKGNFNERIMTFGWISDKYPMLSYRMYKIATEIPDDLWLREIYVPDLRAGKKRNENLAYSIIYVIGYAKDQEQIDYFIDRLKRCDCFTSVRQESTSEALVLNERLLEFKIGLISKPH
ncbi:MAG: hypothetical protein ACUVWN_09170 [bacterium]